MVPIGFAIAAGLFTVLGLYLFLFLICHLKNNLLTALTLPFFIVLFVEGPVRACAMVLIFQVTNSNRPVHGILGFWTMMAWIGTVGTCFMLDRRRLKNWFNTIAGIGAVPTGKNPSGLPEASVHRFGYVPALDGLRGLAILDVIASHFFGSVLGGGYYGVSIFFVISGYIITALLLKEFDTTGTISVLSFYRRRVTRLIPALAVMLATYCLATFIFVGASHGWRSCKESLVPFFFLANWTWALPLDVPRCISHTWSLSLEEQFYLVWSLGLLLMLRAFPNRSYLVLVAGAAALFSWLLRADLCARGTDVLRLYVGLDTRADALMAGCALALALAAGWINEQRKRWLQNWLQFLTPLSGLGLVIASMHGDIYNRATYYWELALVHICTVVLILSINTAACGWLVSLLAMRWLVWVGAISYGLYLWHTLIILKIDELDFNIPAKIIGGTFIPFFIATVSYYCMEKPIIICNACVRRHGRS